VDKRKTAAALYASPQEAFRSPLALMPQAPGRPRTQLLKLQPLGKSAGELKFSTAWCVKDLRTGRSITVPQEPPAHQKTPRKNL
jgi:hypothetical protein